MGALECAGCTMIAFGPPMALFVLVIARDPLRIILFVLGAFFWLMSLLVSALLWFAVVPLREYLFFGLIFSVIFQEVFRLLFFLLLRKAQKGLDKISASGLEIAGVHSLKHARHTVAMGLTTTAMILLHVVWTVVFWNGCHNAPERSSLFSWDSAYISVISVLLSHGFVSGLSFLNERRLSFVSLPLTYFTLALFSVYAFLAVGGKTFVNSRPTNNRRTQGPPSDNETAGPFNSSARSLLDHQHEN